MSPDALILAQNAPKMRLAAGLRPDPLGELTALPQTSWMDSKGPTSRGRGGEERGRGGKGKAMGGEGRGGGMRPILYPDLGG